MSSPKSSGTLLGRLPLKCYFGFISDKLQAQFKGVDETAKILRKNIINTILGYDCSRGNENGCNKTNAQDVDTRGRALIQNSVKELDLVFVLDASSSVTREGFQIGLGFVKKLVRKIGASKRYDVCLSVMEKVVF